MFVFLEGGTQDNQEGNPPRKMLWYQICRVLQTKKTKKYQQLNDFFYFIDRLLAH